MQKQVALCKLKVISLSKKIQLSYTGESDKLLKEILGFLKGSTKTLS